MTFSKLNQHLPGLPGIPLQYNHSSKVLKWSNKTIDLLAKRKLYLNKHDIIVIEKREPKKIFYINLEIFKLCELKF